MPLDPIRLALVQNRLDHIARQMGWVMTRTARSSIFNQSHDFSCFITDAAGTLVSQADGIPIHTGGGGFAVRALLGAFGDDIGAEDAFLLNDPYVAGGNHLPDWVVARPVFAEGQRVAFVCNRAHQSDIGGGAAGTYNAAATEIYHEGVRLPALRLVERGHVRQDLWQLLMINSRTPQLQDGDLRAMLGATRIGAEQVAELFAEDRVEANMRYMEGILEHADRRLRAAVAELPDGTFHGEAWLDDDCFEPMDIRIPVAVTIEGSALKVDFSGAHAQIRGFKNSSLANTYSSVYTALSTFFEHTIPRNEGTFRGVTIDAPEGSIVNPRPPAPVTMCTVFPAQQIIIAIWQALARADPSRSCAAAGTNTFPITSGGQDAGENMVVYHFFGGAGGGAVRGRDGWPNMGPMPTFGGLKLPNAETYEQLYPIHVHRHEMRCDAAGPGEFRGGAGVHYEVDVRIPAEYTFRAEGTRKPVGVGANGGGAGRKGHVEVTPVGGEPFTPPTYGVRNFGPARIVMESPAGGGWGDPLERDVAHVWGDIKGGLVSPRNALEDYGVVLLEDGSGVDGVATAARRAAARSAPG